MGEYEMSRPHEIREILLPFMAIELRATEFAEIVKFLLTRIRIFDGPEDKLAFFELEDALKRYLHHG